MPSSTSSSESVPQRAVPQHRWSLAFLAAAMVTLIAYAAWESVVRAQGYGPSLNDTADRWCQIRDRVGREAGQTVVIGSSRIQFDLDLDTYATSMNRSRPLQLAMPGTNPVAILEDIADETSFNGVLILGVSPGLWFVPQGFPVELAQKSISRHKHWSPSQKIGVKLATLLQDHLAFINPEDLTLDCLLKRIPLPDRAAAKPNLPPVFPAYFAGMDAYRQARLWDRCDFGSERARLIQRTWIPLFTPPPPPPHLSGEEFQAMMRQNGEQYLERIRLAVEKVRSRGGRVVFVRPPSTGTVRELEHKYSPRSQTWDAMLQVTGAPGIHFEDHAQLASFECPEWSHLTSTDAIRYTEALIPLLREAMGGEL